MSVDSDIYFEYNDDILNDINIMRKRHFSSKERHRLTRKNAIMHKKKLKKIAKIGYIPCGAYESETGKEDNSTYVKRAWKSTGKDSSYKYHKAESNRCIRRKLNTARQSLRDIKINEDTDDSLYLYNAQYGDSVFALQNNQYRKCYDLWWIVY